MYTLLQDRAGAVWIGNGWLARYADGHVITYSSATGLSPDVVTALYEDRSGTVWVALPEGCATSATG